MEREIETERENYDMMMDSMERGETETGEEGGD
jgi:hypothetical protein